MTRLLSLHGRASSLVIELNQDSAPLWRYWGPRLADDFAAGPPLATQRPLRGFQLDTPVRFSLCPGRGLGWFSRSAIDAHRNGRDYSFSPVLTALDETPTRLDFTLEDRLSAIKVHLSLEIDPLHDVLSLSSRLTNMGDDVLDVGWLASGALPLPDLCTTVRYYSGRHANEFVLHEDRLGAAGWVRENWRGISSHDCFPGAVVATDGTDDHSGLAYAAQLAWSGNHRQALDLLDDGRRQWQMGVAFAPGEMRLAPGEHLEAPTLLATCSTEGWAGASRNFHGAIRRTVSWPDGPMRPRPVHFNTWEGSYFDHDAVQIGTTIDRAAALGIERFILDDGWFHGRSDDRRALGDWWPDEVKYPDGLKPVADHVVRAGMEFGLWIEPEMVNPDSHLYRAHPEWALHVDGRPLQTSRHQLVLDLGNAEVSDHLFAAIARVITDLPLSYLKWDHNRALTAAGSAGRPAYHRQTCAYYALLGRFREAFPHIEIESCAGGGGRMDAGVARLVHRFWPSDCLDALSRLAIQQGFLQFLPPEMMGSHIGTAPSHTTGRSQPLDFRAAVACQGHFGVELDLAALDDAAFDRISTWIAFYKQWRPLLHQKVWNGSAADSIVWHAAGSREEWILFIYRTAPSTQHFMPPVRLPFVDQRHTYAVKTVTPGREDADALFDGSWLAQAGLPSPPKPAERAAIFHGKRL